VLRGESLVSDCEGTIEQIALALPGDFFQPDMKIWQGDPLVPIGNLLQSFPSEMEAILALSAQSYASACVWIENIRPRCRIVFVTDQASHSAIRSPWIQDLFHVRVPSDETGAMPEILSLENAPVAALFSRAKGFAQRELRFELPGGNQLVGPGFRLVGASFFQGLGGGADFARDPLARDQFLEIDSRTLHVFGYDPAQLANSGQLLSSRNARSVASELMDVTRGREELGKLQIMPWHQYGFHVDQFVSVTGVVRCGKPVLLVADPHPVGESARKLAVDARKKLDVSSRALEDAGFSVVRNPVPFAPAQDSRKILGRLYNNVIVEGTRRSGNSAPLMWLPSFEQAAEFRRFEEANIRIWSDLGFDCIPVRGLDLFASRNGAVRCMTKVIRRNNALK
jgi:hypothetical protein